MASQEVASVVDFPAEVLEMIFNNFDGVSFARSFTVCKKWLNIGRNLEKVFWQTACSDEIDTCILKELLGYREIDELKNNDPIWKETYAKWYRGRMVSKESSWIKAFPAPDDNPITQVKVSGSFVLTGHRSGCVFAWDQLTGARRRCFVQHLMMIVDFVLIDLLHSGPYVSSDGQWDHHHIISVSKDPTVQVNSLMCEGCIDDDLEIAHYHSCGFISIKAFGTRVAMAATDNVITVFELTYKTYPMHKMVLTLIQTITGPSELLQNFQFWETEIQCFCVNGYRKIYNSDDNTWMAVTPQYMLPNRCMPGQIKRSIIRNSFIFRKENIFLTTANNSILTTIDGKNYSECSNAFNVKVQVVSLALFNSVLAIGTESGHLLLYYVPKQESLLDLNLMRPLWSKFLSEASIITISIGDNGNSPVIAASTTERMFIVKWYSAFHQSVIREPHLISPVPGTSTSART